MKRRKMLRVQIGQVVFIFASVILLSACYNIVGQVDKGHAFSPRPLLLRGLPQDSSDYSQGFRDGCYQFIGVNGLGVLRMYQRPIAPENIDQNHPLYQQGYQHGDRYCGVYVNKGVIL
jgi:hypothetical protein